MSESSMAISFWGFCSFNGLSTYWNGPETIVNEVKYETDKPAVSFKENSINLESIDMDHNLRGDIEAVDPVVAAGGGIWNY